MFRGTAQFLVLSLEEKVDISVYFKEDSIEEDILEAKDQLSEIPQVKKIEYVSRQEALERFIKVYWYRRCKG